MAQPHYPTAIISVVETRGPIGLDDLHDLVYAKAIKEMPVTQYHIVGYNTEFKRTLKQLVSQHKVKESKGVYSPALSDDC